MDTATLSFFEQQPEALPLCRNHRYPFQTGISLPAYLLPG